MPATTPASTVPVSPMPGKGCSSEVAQALSSSTATVPCPTSAVSNLVAEHSEVREGEVNSLTGKQAPGQDPQPSCTQTPSGRPRPTPAPAGVVSADADAEDCSALQQLLIPDGPGQPHRSSTKSGQKSDRKKLKALAQSIAGRLEAQGWAVCDNVLSVGQVIAVRKELKVMEEHYTAGEIWVGKEADTGATLSRRDVRGDQVLWLDEQALAATAFVKDGERRACCFTHLSTVLACIDRLVMVELARVSALLRRVRERSAAMCAVYPGGGARFAKHIDNTAEDGRRLTLLCYLNPNWKPSHGGALRLFPPNSSPVDVLPHCGRLAMFLSKTVAHEVMPTLAPRHSFTLWYYDALERAEAVAAAHTRDSSGMTTAAQQSARDLLRDILAGAAAEGDTGVPASTEGMEALRLRVALMPAAALGIVAAVMGLPSAQALRDTVSVMTVDKLAELRQAIANMGLTHQPTV
ncbi:2OG-Fe(II) oxygenase superfamily-domain-containing protein [Haematococcus lacustris]